MEEKQLFSRIGVSIEEPGVNHYPPLYREQVLDAWIRNKQDYPSIACPQELVARQAAVIPDAALVADEQILTYRELNQPANRLTHYLHNLGTRLCVKCSFDLVVEPPGILKARSEKDVRV